ncbi:MAG: YkgJ family cysteine cluster protein [Desulfobacterales bacterium]
MDFRNNRVDSSDSFSCKRCGTCCRKGGPAFHLSDRPLIENGIIPLRYLMTIRKGERVNDPVRGVLEPVGAELIKLKGGYDTWTCTFFDGRNSGCRIYADRPVECRLLKCWDTTDLETIYEKDRLTRRHLLENVAGLWDLVMSHEEKCSWGKLGEMVARLKKDGDNSAGKVMAEIVAYDRHLRRLVVENSGIDPQILDFLFGRPLAKILAMI